MKIIFLDIDGVLNWAGTNDRIAGFYGLCPERIARFNKIIEAVPDAKIVISSTWRHTFVQGSYQNFEELVQLLKDRGLKGEVISKTGWKFSSRSRGSEIREWIEDCQEDYGMVLTQYVILDDDCSGMAGDSYETLSKDSNGDEIWTKHEIADLRPRQVVTSWYGDQRCHPETNLLTVQEEGGLQDRHIPVAIQILESC